MKTVVNQPPGAKVLAELKRPSSKKFLKYLLSPLEQAVINHACQPFKYKLEGIFIYVSRRACKQLLDVTMQKLNLLDRLIDFDKQREHIPFALREVMDDPDIIPTLNPRLRNKLYRSNCYTLFGINQKGRKHFARNKEFTTHNIQALDALFTKYNCSELFI